MISVTSYTLPDPSDGNARAQWETAGRPALLNAFAGAMYGPAPHATNVACRLVERREWPIVRGALRFELSVRIDIQFRYFDVAVALYLPPVTRVLPPLFVGPNFAGNASVDPDPAIPLNSAWMRPEPAWGMIANRATDAARGVHGGRWPIADILKRGYAAATWYDGDLCPDDPAESRPVRDAGFGGAIAAWAWSFSRVLDAVIPLGMVDSRRVAAVGHSRHGKAALWAAANDRRIGLVVSNNSGAGGARLWRDAGGETIADLFERFPHWFANPLRPFAGREHALPFDQHHLLALAAPRAVFVASADDDAWAGPVDEQRAVEAARPFFTLYDREDALVWHRRPGGHGIGPEDWQNFLDFADRALVVSR
ncbi:MAG: acetylxylan esterase [Alphaproteobacteria bacterium]|nr:acetylxylan esterase [Alphaproteobacteria bacterium]